MLKIDRHRFIENELNTFGSILISDMSKKLSCSEETIRRDLRILESQGKLQRIHGGAFLPNTDAEDKSIPFSLRETFISDVKEKLSLYIATELIEENDTVMLDASTTCLSLAKAIIQSNKKITIITNSLRIMDLFRDQTSPVKIIGIGGVFKQRSGSFIGAQAVEAISSFVSNKAFLSPSAISLSYGILDTHLNESLIRKAFIAHTRKTFLILDHTKFEDTADFIISPMSSVSCIITNKPISDTWKKHLDELSISVVYCET